MCGVFVLGNLVAARVIRNRLLMISMAAPLSVFAASLCLGTVARAQGFQIWNEEDFTAVFGSGSVTVPLVDRIVPRLANPQFLAGGLTTDVRLPAHTVLSVGYLVVDLPQRHPSVVRVPLAALSGAFRIGRLTLADRNRLEQLIGLGSSPIRYRNRVSLDWSPGIPNRPHAFTDEEVFYDASASGWNQSRFRIGTGWALRSALMLDVFYLQQSVRGRAQGHVIGTTLKVVLTEHQHE